tara:strand:+ start:5316 stop:5480 length:165 start_codon:yes stop_codon:yes gene_type:complete
MQNNKTTQAPVPGEKPKHREIKMIGNELWQYKRQTGQWHLLLWNKTFQCWACAL